MMLSGYTLGFFFPKQVKSMAAVSPEPPGDRRTRTETRNLDKTRPDADSESREVPAAYYFCRYL